jgi:hypothetical protein
MDAIRLVPGSEIGSGTDSDGSSALAPRPDSEESVTQRFRVHADGLEELEALRHARRMMIREETTLGLSEGEASLDQAIFSAAEIVWTVRPDQRALCIAKIAELARRANHAFEELQELKTLNVRR